MKRYLFLLLALLFIVGCSDKVENGDEKPKEKSNTTSGTEEVAAENQEAQDFSGPLIDENNNVDEREPIDAAFNMQDEVLKPDSTGEFEFDKVMIDFDLIENTFWYSGFYKINSSSSDSSRVHFHAYQGTDKDYLEETDNFDSKEEVDHEKLKAILGINPSKESPMLVGEFDEFYYSMRTDDIKDKDYLKKFGESLEKENDILRTNFGLDLDQIPFPKFNKDRASVIRVGFVLDENKSMLKVKYDIDASETVRINVLDQPHFSTETINETETKAGISVTEFGIDGEEDTRYFGWTDGTYEYAINISKESEIFTEDDIYELIDLMVE